MNTYSSTMGFLGHSYSPDPEDILKACNEATLSAHATLKQGDEGVEKDCVIWEIWLFRCQAVNDCLVESRYEDVDSSQGEDQDDAGKNSNLKPKLPFGPEVRKEDAHLRVKPTPC